MIAFSFGMPSSCATMRYTSDHEENYNPSKDKFIEPELVTGGNATNFASALSPNGAYVFYTSSITGNKDIWVKKISRGVSERLTFHTADDLDPAVSPNGKSLAFVSRRQDATGDIHIMDLSGFRGFSAELGSSSFDQKKTEDTQPRWFADSTRIVFTSRLPYEVEPQIMIGDTESLKANPLEGARGIHPTPSPDGTKICYSSNGALYLHDIKSGERKQLTTGIESKDGQPSFSSDGKFLFFIRYLQDTNYDGQTNADDRPAIWRLDLAKWADAPQISAIAAVPLTSSRYSSYYPRLKAPYLYFTMQSQQSLDIFRLPEFGHMQIDYNINASDIDPESFANEDDTSFAYLRKAHILYSKNAHDELNKLLRRMLFWQVQTNQVPQAQWTYNLIRELFPDAKDLHAFAELLLVKLKIQSISYPDRKFEPTDLQAEILLQSHHAVNAINERIPATSTYRQDSDLVSQAIKARIAGSHRQYFKALKELEDMIATTKDPSSYVKAEAQLLIAELITTVMDRETAILKLVDVIEHNKANQVISKKAAHIIVNLITEKFANSLEVLAQVRERYVHLPWLSPIAHRAIANYYQKIGDTDVAVNEFREMVKRYTNTPDIVLKSAETLVKLADVTIVAGIETELENLYTTLKANDFIAETNQALEILVRFRVKKAEYLMRSGNLDLALQQYESIVAIDPMNLNGHRGIINISVKRNEIEVAIAKYEQLQEDNPKEYAYSYLLTYAMTYLIDNAEDTSDRIDRIDEALDLMSETTEKRSKVVRVRQTLGWLEYQKHLWEKKRANAGGFLYNLGKRARIFGTYFGYEETDWLDLAINNYLTALFLSKPNSYERAEINQNLAEAYFELRNYKKALAYYITRIRELHNFPTKSAKEEAILTYNAARAAFQLAEVEISRDLFTKSLSKWQTIGRNLEIAKNLDYLGLVNTELKNFATALDYYQKLLDAAKRDKNNRNIAVASLNIVSTLIELKRVDEAQTILDDIKLMLADESLTFEVAKPDAIEIGLAGGQASETSGFNKTSRLIQLATYQELIYRSKHDLNGRIAAIKDKIALQEAKRDEEIDAGRGDLYYSEEVMTTYMTLGSLYREASSFKLAESAFIAALENAHLRRGEDKKKPIEAETNALTAVLSCRLDAILSNQSADDNTAEVLSIAQNHITALMAEPLSLIDKAQLAKLSPIIEQIKLSLKQPNFDGYDKVLTEFLDAKPNDLTTKQALLAINIPTFVNDLAIPSTKQVALLQKQAASDRYLKWKYLIAKGMWQEAYSLAAASIAKEPDDEEDDSTDDESEPFIKTSLDLKVFDKLFDFQLHQSWQVIDPDVIARNLLSHLNLRLKAMALMIWQNISEDVGYALDELDFDTIAENLQHGQKIIYLHKNQYAPSFLLLITPEGFELSFLPEPSEKAIANLLKAQQNTQHYYVVLNEFAQNLDWQSLVGDTSRSYIATPSEIPYAASEYIPLYSAWIDIGETKSELVKSDEPSDYHHQNHIDKLYPAGNFLLIRKPVTISGYHPGLSQISVAGHQQNIHQWRIKDLDDLHTIIYANTTIDTAKVSHFTQADSLSGLHLITLAKGAQTTVIANSSQISNEDWHQSIIKSQQGHLAKLATKKKAMIIGYVDITGPATTEELQDAYDAATDEGEYRKALQMAALLEDPQQITDTIEALRDAALGDGDLPAAYHFHKMFMARFAEKDSYEYAEELNKAGQFSIKLDVAEEGITHLKQAIAIFTKEEDLGAAAESLRNLSICYERTKDYQESIKTRLQALSLFQQEGEDEQAAEQMLDIGNLYNLKLSDYNKALEYYFKAEEAFKELGNNEKLERVAIDKANTFTVIGRLGEAISILSNLLKSIKLTEVQPDQKNLAKWLRTSQMLANAYYRAAQNSKGADLLNQMLKRIDQLENSRIRTSYQLDATNLQAMIKAETGFFLEGISLLEEGLKIAERNNLKGKMTQRYNNLGFLYRENGQYEESIAALEKALKIDTELESEVGIAFDRRNLGLAWMLMGNDSLAKDFLTKALQMSIDLNLPYNQTYCHLGLADLASKHNNHQEALNQYRLALESGRKGFLRDLQWRSLVGIAKALMVVDPNSDQALVQMQHAIDIIQTQPPGQKTESSETGLTSDMGIRDAFAYYATLLMDAGKVTDSWRIAELSKARIFIDTMATQEISFSNDAIPALLAKARRTQAHIRQMTQSWEQAPTDTKSEIAQEIKNQNQVLSKLLAEAEALNPRLKDLIAATTADLANIQQTITKNSGVVEYLTAKDHVLIWVIDQQNISGQKVPFSNKLFKRKVTILSNLLNNYSTAKFISSELSQSLIDPITSRIESFNHLTIVPDGILHKVSFAILPYKGGLLIDSFPISYNESTTLLASLPSGTTSINSSSNILAMSLAATGTSQLPFTAKEVAAMKRYFHNLTSPKSTSDMHKILQSKAESYDILHLATHGSFDPISPAKSYIALGPDDSDENHLTVANVFNLNLKARLVTLSACESGITTTATGAAIIGFNRALFFAGAHKVVTSLWRINDVTSAIIMKRFYRYLSEGASESVALQKAQKTVRQYFPHPAYWAGFRVVGR